MAVERPEMFNEWVNRLEAVTNVEIKDYAAFLDAVRKRHEFFHNMGCRLSDHGIEEPYAEDYVDREITYIFHKVRRGKALDLPETRKFKSAMLHQFAILNNERNWTMQMHLGALRNTNTRGFKRLGSDTGYDSMGDFQIARSLARFYDRLDAEEKLPRTIVYPLNPRDFAMAASLVGSFQDGKVAGKMQLGAAWWFNDTRRGMEEQMNVLSEIGLLSQFVGMVTDSRSFLSYPRHAYFRRILCNLIGQDVERGELPGDIDLLGRIVQDISYHNAVRYFGLDLG
jgi:glucuronate isomerase